MKQLKFNKNWILGTVAAIMLSWVALFAFTASATSTSDKVKDAKEDLEKSQNSLEQSKKDVEDAQNVKAQLEGKLASLNEELSNVSSQLEDSETKLSDKQQQIADIKIQLASAEAVETQQYVDMKKRIQYMYENAGSDMLQTIFDGGSFSDMLNKADFFQRMTEYDRQMLEEYSQTKTQIQQAEDALEQEESELKKVVAEVAAKQKEVDHLVTQTSEEVAKQQSDLDLAEQKALEYEKKLIEQQNTLEALEKQEAEEKAILAEQERQKKLANAGSTKVTYDANGKVTGSGTASSASQTGSGYEQASSESDLKLLATIIYCEAGNQPYEGMIAVGSVVMNRINSSSFPNSMIGVLYQSRQFTPVSSGRFAIALANNSATDRCYAAAQEVLNGKNNVPDCLFFRTVIPGKEGTIIGDHVFY